MASVQSASRESYGNFDIRENNENRLVFRCARCNVEVIGRNLLKLHCKEHKEITDLDNNGIENIFKYLSPDDLAAMSQTCKQYKQWAERYVARGKVFVPLKIVVNEASNFKEHGLQFTLNGYNNYGIQFHKFIPYLELDLFFKPTVDHMVQLYTFIRDDCAENLKHLTIMGRILLGESIGIISEQIKNLILLKIQVFGGLKVLLERCKEIKVLIYVPPVTYNLGNALLETCSKLDVFILAKRDQALARFADFLQANPQLKAIIQRSDDRKNIQDILLTANNLPFAAIALTKYRFPEIQDAFERCCERKNIQTLEVLLGNVHNPFEEFQVLDIFRMQYVSGLHFIEFPRLTRINEIAIQPKLQRLCVNIEEEKISIQLNELMDRLPECTELRLKGWPNIIIKDLLMPLISRNKKLEHIYLDCEAIMDFTTDEAMELNAARSQLVEASKLCIHLNKKTTITDIMGSYAMNAMTIQLERDEDIKCPLCSWDSNKNLQFLRMNNIYNL